MTTGNLAKDHILEELSRMLSSQGPVLDILDVGITGPQPMRFWSGLVGHERLRLHGVDIDEKSVELLRKEPASSGLSSLGAVSGYDIAEHFGKGSFDVVVSTQVLEHMKYPMRFIAAAASVLKEGGILFLSLDNGDYPRAHNPFKQMIKDLVVGLSGNERYHDKDIPSDEVAEMLRKAGLKILDSRRYNIHPLKQIHNAETPSAERERLAELWKAYEDRLNTIGHAERHSDRYLVSYFKAKKGS